MKLAIFLLALGVCINAASISNELVEKFELPSVSALLVTELLEATFHVPADLAQAIGHLFRDVPISLAKEMIAFVVKVFGDLTHGHLDALNQYMEQAIHIFAQVVQHINPKEVAALIAEEVLPENWIAILEKLMHTLGKRDEKGVVIDALITTAVNGITTALVGWVGNLLGKRSDEKGLSLVLTAINIAVALLGKRQTTGDYWDEFVGAVVDWGVSVIESAVTSVVTGFFGLFGKRDLKGWGIIPAVIDAVIDTVIEEVTTTVTGWFGNLLGKREAKGWGIIPAVIDAVIDTVIEEVTTTVTGWFGNLLGKREEKGLIGSFLITTFIIDPIVGWVGDLLGKRSDEKGWILTTISIAATLLGKRQTTGDYWDEFVGAVVDWGVSVIESAVTSVVTGFFGLFGKRSAEKGLVINYVVGEYIVKPLTTWIGGLFGKRQAPGF